MTYRPVVDHVAVPVALDPLSALIFAALFVAVALFTARRPVYGLCALVLATPAAFAHDVLGTTVTLPKCVLLGLLLGLTAYRGALRELHRPAALPLLAALLLYTAATALTIIVATHLTPAVRETLKWVEYTAAFSGACLAYALDPDDGPLVAAFAIAALAVAASALAQELAGAPSGLYVGNAVVPRIAGLLEGPNQLAAYCTVALAALGAWSVQRSATLTSWALGAIVCAGVLSFSRAGIVAGVLVVAILVLWSGRRAWPALRPALLGAVAGCAGALWWAVYARAPGIMRVTLAPSAYAGGVGNRGELWSAAWRMFVSRPALGVGAGNFELELPRYGVYGVRTHANSWYLQSLAEGGVLLFGATLVLVAASIGAFLRRPWLARLRAQSPWVAAAVAASVALSLHQLVDDFVFYPKVGGAWFVLLGIAAAAFRAF